MDAEFSWKHLTQYVMPQCKILLMQMIFIKTVISNKWLKMDCCIAFKCECKSYGEMFVVVRKGE